MSERQTMSTSEMVKRLMGMRLERARVFMEQMSPTCSCNVHEAHLPDCEVSRAWDKAWTWAGDDLSEWQEEVGYAPCPTCGGKLELNVSGSASWVVYAFHCAESERVVREMDKLCARNPYLIGHRAMIHVWFPANPDDELELRRAGGGRAWPVYCEWQQTAIDREVREALGPGVADAPLPAPAVDDHDYLTPSDRCRE